MGKISDFDRFGVESIDTKKYANLQATIISKCLCSKCNSYVQGDNPTGYCFPLIGTSQKIHNEKDCICSTCPVYKEHELDHTYYCTRCSHICQTYKTQTAIGP